MLLARSDLAGIIVNKPVIDARTDPTMPPTGIVDMATGTYRPITQPVPLTLGEKVVIGAGIVGGIGLLVWLASKMPPAPVVYYDDGLYGTPVVVRRRSPVVVYQDDPTVVVDEAPSLLVNPRKGKKRAKTKRNTDSEIRRLERLIKTDPSPANIRRLAKAYERAEQGEPPDHSAAIKALEAKLEEKQEEDGQTQYAVDDLIYDHVGTSKSASNINNNGFGAQLEALVERLGIEETTRLVREVLDS